MLLAGRYRLLEQIARGGMGAVWRARDETLQREVAVKVLHAQAVPGGTDAELAAERAMREARITARLHHPHAVPVFDVVDHEGRPCLVMQYLPSKSLQTVLDENGPLPPAQVARLGAEVASALAAAHRLGIIHRDVKPANVLIADDGSAKLTDFGISQSLGDSSLTSVGFVTGTPAYIAPEVARGGSAGFASDVYSLGSTLYRASEGRPPHGRDGEAMAVLAKVVNGQLEPPTRSGALGPLLQRMLATDTAARPPMHNVALELRELAGGAGPRVVSGTPGRPDATTALPTAAPPRGPLPPVTPLPRDAEPSGGRRRGAWIAVAALAVLLVALGALFLATRGDDGTPVAGGSTTPSATTATTPPPTTASDTPSDTPSDTASDTPSDTPTSSASSTADTGAPTADDLANALTSYYALLPGDTDTSFQRLTPSYQQSPSGGIDGYRQFWGSITSVTVSDVVASPPDTVTATLSYVFDDGRTAVERTTFGFVDQDGQLLIDSSQVVG